MERISATPDAATPADQPVRPPRQQTGSPILPAEYEHVDYLLVGWHTDLELFLLDIIEASWGHAELVVVLSEDQDRARVEEALAARELDPGALTFVHGPIESPWIRDYGPLVVQYPSGARRIVDLLYSADTDEDRVPTFLGRTLWRDWGVTALPIALDGGNLLSDGEGRCFTTLGYPDSKPAQLVGGDDEAISEAEVVDLAVVQESLASAMGCKNLTVLPKLWDEPTHHVDMYLTITGPNQVIVGEYRPDDDPFNAPRLDEVAALLRSQGMLVRRVPMPDHMDGHFRSYTNSLAVNGVVLVPVYPEADRDEARALAVFREAYPDREIIPIVATDAIELEGTVHCTTMTVTSKQPKTWWPRPLLSALD